MIDELNGAPTPTTTTSNVVAATTLRPFATYPLNSAIGARAPPNSPREALVATSVPAAWAAAADNGAATMTDVEANGYHHQQRSQEQHHQQQQQQDERRPLDLAMKATKRHGGELAEKDEKKKRKRGEFERMDVDWGDVLVLCILYFKVTCLFVDGRGASVMRCN